MKDEQKRAPLFEKANVRGIGAIIAAVVLTLAISGVLPVDSISKNCSTSSAYAAKRDPQKVQFDFFSKLSFKVEGVELLQFLESYSKHYGFTFFLDRRVDPSTQLTGDFTNQPFFEALNRLFADAELSFCLIDDSLLFVGPSNAAGEALLLMALKDEGVGLENAPTQMMTRLSAPVNFRIPPYSEPKEVFKSLGQRTHLKLSGFDKTPFDLWRGAEFENIVTAKLITLFGLGFNVDYQYDSSSSSIRPVSLDRDALLTRYYPESAIRDLDARDFDDCEFVTQTVGNEDIISVSGPFKSIAVVELFASQNMVVAPTEPEVNRQASPATNARTTGKEVRILGEVNNAPLRDLFSYLEKNAGVHCTLDPSLSAGGITLDTRVSCKFNNSNVSQIARIIAREIRASADVNGNSIIFHK